MSAKGHYEVMSTSADRELHSLHEVLFQPTLCFAMAVDWSRHGVTVGSLHGLGWGV